MPDDLGAGQPGEFLGIVTRDTLARSLVADDGDQGVASSGYGLPGRSRSIDGDWTIN